MNVDRTQQSSEVERESTGLFAGTVLAALLALVFGTCLMTILDVTRHAAPRAATNFPAKHAATVLPASF
jgi:hypothetical protein